MIIDHRDFRVIIGTPLFTYDVDAVECKIYQDMVYCRVYIDNAQFAPFVAGADVSQLVTCNEALNLTKPQSH